MPKARKSSKKTYRKTGLQPKPRKHLDTPQRAKVQGALKYLHAKGIPEDDRDVFDFFGVSYTTGYKIFHQPSRTGHNQLGINETRGRKHKMTSNQVLEVDHLVQDDGLEIHDSKALPWIAIAWELDIDVCL